MQHAGFRSLRAFACLVIACCAVTAPAAEPLRIWVDSTGRHAIKAHCVARENGRVILQRADGKRLTIAFDQLSVEDKDYLRRLENLARGGPNPLRSAPPALPRIDPLPPLDLAPAETIADPRALLPYSENSRLVSESAPAGRLDPDPAARPCQVPLGRTIWESREVHSSYSPAMPIEVAGQSVLVMSVAGGFGLPATTAPGRLMSLKPGDAAARTAWQGDETIRLLDHHHDSGRSLALVDHNSLGEGGELAVVTGWENANVTVEHRRRLPGRSSAGGAPCLSWARWIDEQHIVALIDDSLAGWNMISGKPLFRIEGFKPKARPALSKGRRYIAVPRYGAVELFRSTDGQSLGKIATEKDELAMVNFSPRGDALAIATPRRLLIWELSSAAPRSDVPSQRTLGRGRPMWISDDLVMTSNGTLISAFRGVPLWRYDLSGAIANPVGDKLAVFREHPQPELATVALPHSAARRVMRWIDSGRPKLDPATWELPGRSKWHDGKWVDSD